MAITFVSENAKSSTYTTETLEAQNAGITVDTKKGLIIGDESNFGNVVGDRTIDVSESKYFKQVSVSGGYTSAVNVIGNPNVANIFYAGGGGGVLDGGDGYSTEVSNGKVKLTTSADKFYGGAGNDIFVYAANGGKDNIYSYGDGDVIQLKGYDSESQSLTLTDKSGGLTINISDSDDSTVTKNSTLTIDGKTKTASNSYGFVIVDEEGNPILKHGALVNGVSYGKNKKGAADTTALVIDDTVAVGSVIDASQINTGIKTINASTSKKLLSLVGNGNANNITIGSGGGTLDGAGYSAVESGEKTTYKTTNDNLYGTSANVPVTFVYNGGKDVIYNYKNGDNVVINETGGEAAAGDASLTYSGKDAVIKFDTKNTVTIKNALGKVIMVDGTIDEENSHTLPTGLNYDSMKLAKITADDVVITAGDSSVETIWVDTVSASEGPIKKPVQVIKYNTIIIGGSGENSAEIASTVKEVDLSASSAPVIIDTSANASITSVKLGKAGGTVYGTGSDAVSGDATLVPAQTFTGGGGADLFVIDAGKVLDAEDPSKAKSDTIANIGGGDKIQIVGTGEDDVIAFNEKGKDLVITVNGLTVVTVKNATTVFGSGVPLDILNKDGTTNSTYPIAMPTGLNYGLTKAGKTDKTSLITNDNFNDKSITAEPYGGASVKTINASTVSGALTSLQITGSSANNTITAPTDAVAVTLDGAEGNDVLVGGGGAVTYVFNAQAKKKDTINNYKEGDLILFNGNDIDGIGEVTSDGVFYSATVKGEETSVDGFNDSKANVVITFNKNNTLTLNNAAGTPVRIADISAIKDDGTIDEAQVVTLGHVMPTGLTYDAKKTTVLVAENNTAYNLEVDLSDAEHFFSSAKNVDFTDKAVTAKITGNSVANDIKVGSQGSTVDTGLADKPVADKVTGGNGADVFIYQAGYGKDVFSNVAAADMISLGAGITKSNLTITDKKDSMTVAITSGNAISTEKGATNTTANSTFTINKSGSNAVTFAFADGGANYVYGARSEGVALDAKYTTLTITNEGNATVDVSAINSQPKTIDARPSTAGNKIIIGNANADVIYAGAGSTTLFGGTAGTKGVKDTLYGNSKGADTFLYTTQDGEKKAEADIINNYDSDSDVIVLDRAPTSVKASGKNVVLNFEDELPPANENSTKTTVVKSSLTINGTAQDDTLKKFNNIDELYGVKIAVVASLTDANGNLSTDVGVARASAKTYHFAKSSKAVEWSEIVADEDAGGDESEQLAAGAWFEQAVSTDNAVGSELDSILSVKGVTDGEAAQLQGDAYFTTGATAQSAGIITSARARAKK